MKKISLLCLFLCLSLGVNAKSLTPLTPEQHKAYQEKVEQNAEKLKHEYEKKLKSNEK